MQMKAKQFSQPNMYLFTNHRLFTNCHITQSQPEEMTKQTGVKEGK